VFYKSVHDYQDLGQWNVFCAYCGRKRKAGELVRDAEFAMGLWCCPEHADQRHPQDFARGVKDDMSVPFSQPPVISFVELPLSFPLTLSPSPLVLAAGVSELVTELTGDEIITETGSELTTEQSYLAFVVAQVPGWIVPVSFAWSWASGGAGVYIDSPDEVGTYVQTLNSGATGVLQCTVVDELGDVATATVEVTA
jgi:hypothetical protein